MIESRCGILCGKCGFKDTCKGCTQIEKPFWGESCPVKSCCEGKGHVHCGQCADFPCELSNRFAYDPEQGDNGLRLEQCRKWKQEE